MTSARLVVVLDLVATSVFALEGATAAIVGRLDLLGVLVVGFVTALGGGIIRDVLIGQAPPQAFRDWKYAAIALGAGLSAFLLYEAVKAIPPVFLVTLDAAGLALFAIAGTEKAIEYRLPPMSTMMIGAVTGTGGGVVRDVLLASVPVVLRTDVYVTAALAGSLATIVSLRLGCNRLLAALIGIVLCFGLRMVSVWQHWNLPTILAG